MSAGWRIAAVIPAYNRLEETRQCINSLRLLTRRLDRIYLVDAGSTDGTREWLRAERPEVTLVAGSAEWLWSRCINEGFARARADGASHFWILNQDVEAAPDALANLEEALARMDGEAVVGPTVCYHHARGTVWSAGGYVQWLGRGVRHYGLGTPYCRSDRPDAPREVTWLPGMGSLIPAELAARLGDIDDRVFPHYFGDCDFCLRLRRAGGRIFVIPHARIWHRVGEYDRNIVRKPRPWRAVVGRFFTWRTPVDLRTNLRFYLRHAPRLLLPIALFLRVAYLAGIVINDELAVRRRSV